MRRLFYTLIIFIISSDLLFATQNSLEKITFQLQWKDQFEFAGFYAAKEKGFYEEVGLDVSFKSFTNELDIVDEVLEGRAEYGVVYSSIISRYMNGAPLLFVANFFKQSPLVVVAQKEFFVPSDLVGKKVMGVTKELDRSTLLMMFQKFGMNAESFESVAPTFNVDDFIAKKVDAMTVFNTNETYYLDKAGVHYNVMNPAAYGVPFYDLNLFTTQKELAEHPNRVAKFREASIKGWEYALAHKEELIELILTKHNTQNKSYDALKYEAMQIEQMMLPSIYPIGSIDTQRVNLMAEQFVEIGAVENKAGFDLNTFVYRPEKQSTVTLTKAEQEYLKNKKEIKVCIQPDLYPIDGFIDLKHTGQTGDLYRLLARKLHVDFSYVVPKSQLELEAMTARNKCEVISITSKHQKRFENFNVTNPVMHVYFDLITLHDKIYLRSEKELIGKRVLTKFVAFKRYLETVYPELHIEVIDNVDEAMKMLKNKEAYGFVTLNGISDMHVQKYGFDRLKVNGIIGKLHPLEGSIGVAKSSPILLRILNKTLDTIEPATLYSIQNRWQISRYHKTTDYVLIWQISTVALLLLLIMMYWNRRLKREVEKRHDAEKALKTLNESLEEKVKENMKVIYAKEKILQDQTRLAQMGEMVGMIAHQWRQPLGALSATAISIQNKLELKQFDLKREEQREAFESYLYKKLGKMSEYVSLMSDTIEDFLGFFKKERRRELIRINEVIEKALDIMHPILEHEAIEVVLDLKEVSTLMSNKNEFMQVILNLLKNAEEAFIEKNIKHKMITFDTYEENHNVCVRICDNAGGVCEVNRSKIFDPYFSTKMNKNGTGLGLYMSKMIIEEHHEGKMEVENRDGWACFTLYLPFEIRKEKE